jgi:hypothetical protein
MLFFHFFISVLPLSLSFLLSLFIFHPYDHLNIRYFARETGILMSKITENEIRKVLEMEITSFQSFFFNLRCPRNYE